MRQNPNTSLTDLYCGDNQLNILNISGISTLENLFAYDNNLGNINTSTNPNLRDYYSYNNQLTSINISSNPLLRELYCWGNQISGILDLSPYNNLESTNFGNNLFSSVIVGSNPVLYSLSCENNQIVGINVSTLPILNELICSGNLLTCLNVKNGNNTNFNLFDATNNPSLTCIEVDNTTWSTTNWTIVGGNISSGMTFSTSCTNPCTVGIDEYELSSASIYPNPSSSRIKINGSFDFFQIIIINLTGKLVRNVAIETNSIDISDLNSGIYFVKLIGDNGKVVTKKFIKQ